MTRLHRHIDRPIFVVGSGRSGTTLVYEMLALHPSTAWFSTHTSRWPRASFLAAFNRVWISPAARLLPETLVPRPAEGYRIWDHCDEAHAGTGPLSAGSASTRTRACLRSIVSAHLRYQRKDRFLNKNTRNTARVGYIDALFPDALFIHVVRDPRAAAASLLRVAWWNDLPVWCEGGVTPREWRSGGRDEIDLAASLWAAEVEEALRQLALVPSARHLQVRYEDVVASPRRAIGQILRHCELDRDDTFERAFGSYEIHDSRTRFLDQLTPEQIRKVETRTGVIASRLGYGFD